MPAAAFFDPILDRCRPPLVEGRAEAVDGDTLALEDAAGGTVVLRLMGLDAPEVGQWCRANDELWPCGSAARAALGAILAEGPVACTTCGSDPLGAILARCRVGGTDVGARLLRQGMAVNRAFFTTAFQAGEAAARREGLGLWRGDFVDPSAWRRGLRLGDPPCVACLAPGP